MENISDLLHCPHRLPRLCSELPLLVAMGLAWGALAVWWVSRRVG